MQYCPNIQKIFFNDCNIDDPITTESLIKLMGTLKHLKELYMRGNKIGSSGVAGISKLKGLEVLDLSNNGIGDRRARRISRMKLKMLYLNNNRIGTEGAQALSKMKKLEMLDINGNRIDDLGSDALRGMPSLQQISISNNKLSEQAQERLKSTFSRVVMMKEGPTTSSLSVITE
jgi:Leucine-rich repeat (LRR) protein